jgi:isocitrate/isopropylmalate dehydrogenase
MGESHAVFEAVHGSAPHIAGQGNANPTALMLSAVMLLVHLGETEVSQKLQNAVEAVYREGNHLTGDAGGIASTQEFTDAVIAALKQN